MSESESLEPLPCGSTIDATVAICTYKRPLLLLTVLQTLEQQEVDSCLNWEVLVIDNDQDCSARTVFQSHLRTSRLQLRYLQEKSPGLSQARNRAIEESRGAIIAFLDDDVIVPPAWLCQILMAFERTGADCVGGRVLVHWDGEPEDVVKAAEKELVSYDRGPVDHFVKRRDVPIGANLAFKAKSLDRRPFASALGRKEEKLMGCEEIELLLRLLRTGRSIWYSAGSVVLHRISGERLSSGYYKRREYWNGVSLALVDKLHYPPLFCYFKAWARLTQVIIVISPASLWAYLRRNEKHRFLYGCYSAKYLSYWRSIARPPEA